jgi:hypothetical protein
VTPNARAAIQVADGKPRDNGFNCGSRTSHGKWAKGKKDELRRPDIIFGYNEPLEQAKDKGRKNQLITDIKLKVTTMVHAYMQGPGGLPPKNPNNSRQWQIMPRNILPTKKL